MTATAELKARATLDSGPFQRGIAQMQGSVRGFATGQLRQLGGMIGGAFAASAFVNFAKNVGQAADNLQDMAKNLGLNVEQLQALQVTAERTGASSEQMNQVLMRASKAGVGIEQLAKAYLGLDNSTLSVADAQLIVGRQGAALNETFNKIANDGIANMTSSMLNANQIMSEDTVNAAAAMQESYEKMAASIKNTLATALIFVIEKIKLVSAFLGALSAGSSFAEASDIASTTVNKELYSSPGALKNRSAIKTKADRKAAGTWKPPEMGEISVSAPTAADSLASIGGIAGGQTSMMKGAIERQSKILEETQKINKAIEEHAKKTAESTGTIEKVMTEE